MRSDDGIDHDGLIAAFTKLRSASRVVDLAPEIHSAMPVWDSHPDAVVVADARNHAKHGYFAQTLVISEHTGAHVDAPHHFHASLPQGTVDAYAPDALIGPFKHFDLRSLDPQPGQLLTASDLRSAAQHGGFTLEEGDVALLDFGWSRHYHPDDPDWAVRQWWARNAPGLDEGACAYLAEASPRAVGSDTPACDVAVVDGEMKSDFGHRTYFLPRGIAIIEGLANLDELPSSGLFIAAPLRIRGGSGSPIRPIALVAR